MSSEKRKPSKPIAKKLIYINPYRASITEGTFSLNFDFSDQTQFEEAEFLAAGLAAACQEWKMFKHNKNLSPNRED